MFKLPQIVHNEYIIFRKITDAILCLKDTDFNKAFTWPQSTHKHCKSHENEDFLLHGDHEINVRNFDEQE